MYSKEEATKIKKDFWTKFGQFLSLHPSNDGIKINWINYKTGIKNVHFRMDVVKKTSFIGIELHHQDSSIRELYFEQFLELKTYLHSILKEEWVWQKNHQPFNSEKQISRIYLEKVGYTIMNEDHWPEIISFLKPRVLKLDEFWSDAKYSFDALK